MQAVQRIECKDKAAFNISFVVTNGNGETPSSGSYPVLQSRTIDLASSKFNEGDTIWPIVTAIGGKAKPADTRFTFAMNGQTAVYEATGSLFGWSVTFKEIDNNPDARPPGFPLNIAISQEQFLNWDQTINVPAVWTCQPRTAQDVVDACNWATKNSFKVRPRGIMHNWSPLSVTPGLPSYANLLLVDFTVCLNAMTFIPSYKNTGPAVQVGAGATLGALLQYLEQQQGNGSAPGYSFPHTPAPENLTVGGMLAINAHGSAVPTPPNDNFATTYGSMSNRILSLTVVVTDPSSPTPGTYQLKTFERGDKDLTALMTQLGRTLIVEAVLQVVDNYNMRCLSITNLSSSVLFAAPSGNTPPPNSCADFLNQSGRIEVIWFPFTEYPWFKVWTVEATKPASSRQVDQPNNYVFSDNLPPWVTSLINTILYIDPSQTVSFGQMFFNMSNDGLDGKVLGFPVLPQSRDIWGPSKNTLLYVKDSTLRVTANGYAVLMNKANVQQSIYDFTQEYENLLNSYKGQNKYPVNAPVEIRVTGLDDDAGMPSITGGPAGRPVISAIAADATSAQNNWDVAVWFDVLCLPGTKYSNDFYTDLENWFVSHFKSPTAKMVAEWSKGWAYTSQGGWTNQQFIAGVKEAFTAGRANDDNWQWEAQTLSKYDGGNIFQSQLTEVLFG